MAVQKNLRFLYQSKNNTTGLTDITAQIYVNDVSKAVGVNAIAHTANANGSKVQEVDATNSPGLYEVLLTAADLTAWGVTQSDAFYLEAWVDSAGHSAPAPFRIQVTLADTDDIDVKLGTPAGASVSADIASIKSDTTTILADQSTIISDIGGVSTQVTNLQSDITNNVEGAGFSNSTDSLHQISTYVRANLFSGGRAI